MISCTSGGTDRAAREVSVRREVIAWSLRRRRVSKIGEFGVLRRVDVGINLAAPERVVVLVDRRIANVARSAFSRVLPLRPAMQAVDEQVIRDDRAAGFERQLLLVGLVSC